MIGTSADRDCPHDEALAAWIEGRGNGATRAAIERHVTSCTACLDVVAAVLAPADEAAERRATNAEPAPARRRSAARWALAASVLLTTTALAYGAMGLFAERARVELERRVGAALGEPVAIERLHLGLARGFRGVELRLDGISIGETEPVTADAIQLTVPFASLATRTPAVGWVRVVGLVIRIATESTTEGRGRLGGRPDPVVAAVGTTPLEIAEGTLVLDVPGAPIRFDHLAGTTTPADGRVQVALDGTIAGGTVHAEGELAADAAGPVSLTIAGRGLTAAALPFVQGKISGTADLLVRITGTVGAPAIAGRAVVSGGRLAGWNPLQPLLARGDAAGALAAHVPQLAGSDLVFDELRIAVSSTADGWHVPRVYVTSGGVVAGASLEVGGSREVHGDGSVRLPTALATALLDVAPALAALRDQDQTLTVPIVIGGTVDAPRITPRLAGAGVPPPSY